MAALILPPESTMGGRVFTVEILNGTNIGGLAGRTAELFRGFGYEVVSIGNADRNDHEKTLIIDRSGYEQMARGFGEIIRCNNFLFDFPHHEGPESDFTLIIGRDFNGRYVTE